MNFGWARRLVAASVLVFASGGAMAQIDPLSAEDAAAAAADYQRYCSLCHGENREGYKNDNAPSLKSSTLLAPGNDLFLFRSITYGRPGTPMAAYREEFGGPMNNREIFRLVAWLYEQVGVNPRYNEDGSSARIPWGRIDGDVDKGAKVFKKHCASCHGANGEGDTGTAITNKVFLIFASDNFIKKTILEGRNDTPMVGFEGKLSEEKIDNVIAWLRSHATAEGVTMPVVSAPPTPENYVMNPDGADPEFDLDEGIYVSAVDLHAELQKKPKLIMLDTRTTSWWQMGHIEGAIPIPYYSDFDEIVDDLPKDVWIVGYCECPRAAAEHTIRELRERGFDKTAVLYEGIQGWVAAGFPVVLGDVTAVDPEGSGPVAH